MRTRLQELFDRRDELRRQLHTADTERREAREQARRKVDELFAPRLDPINEELGNIAQEIVDMERRAAEQLAQSHPLVGRKVTAFRKPLNAGWYDKPKTVYGIVEVVTSQTVQPRRRLPLGTVVVRRIGAGGRMVKTIEVLGNLRGSDEAEAYLTKFAENQRDGLRMHQWALVD